MEAAKFHAHYLLQAEWLAPARHYLFRKAALARRAKILDLGCGSGFIADEMRQICGRPVMAVDRDPEMVAFARGAYPENEYLVGDENTLLREGNRFDLIVISFVLMWQRRPLSFLKKVRKLLGENGMLLVMAEPDYGGRIDFPSRLDFLKGIFIEHIEKAGGDPFIGRKLASLLREAGFKADVELASALNFPRAGASASWRQEWLFWQELAGFDDAMLRKIMRLENSATIGAERLVVFPVFCALAKPR